MRKYSALFKGALYAYFADFLFYLTSIVTVVFCAFRFFFTGKFFSAGAGSTDLRIFFQSFSLVCVLVIPLLTFRLRAFIVNDGLPLKPFFKTICLNFAVFCAFLFPVILLFSLPVCVSFFGNIDSGAAVSGFFGICLYALSSSSLCVFLFQCFYFSSALALIFSVIILAFTNFVHFLPLYFNTGNALAFLVKSLSFAWHFNSSGKGIADSRDVSFYVFAFVLFTLFSVLAEHKRSGKKENRLSLILIALSFVFFFVFFQRVYVRIDFSKGKKFSVSSTSKELINKLDENLRITYFMSPELKKLYPQTSDVSEYLSDFASESGKITLTFENADPQKMKNFNIQGQQIRNETGTKIEFITVYSAIVLQYVESVFVIPFVLSLDTLEYDLAQRLRQMISKKTRDVLIINGNGKSVSQSYSYVIPWLSSRGFSASLLDINENEGFVSSLDALDSNEKSNTELLILGSSKLTIEQSAAIERAVKRGVPAFFAVSPYETSIESDWKVSKNPDDTLLPALNSWGFSFENALIQDLACFPLTMQTGEGRSAEYQTMNYPLWISVLPQGETSQGITLFWSSPLVLYDEAESVLRTTDYAWLQEEGSDLNDLFLVNPFLIPKSSSAAQSQNGKYTVAAKTNSPVYGYYESGKNDVKTNIFVLSDQYFADSLMTGFISGDVQADLRNFDFLAFELLKLRGEEKIALLINRAKTYDFLYKIADEERFLKTKKAVLIFNFAFLPAFVAVSFFGFWFFRKRFNRHA